jgi:hypothetical protein
MPATTPLTSFSKCRSWRRRHCRLVNLIFSSWPFQKSRPFHNNTWLLYFKLKSSCFFCKSCHNTLIMKLISGGKVVQCKIGGLASQSLNFTAIVNPPLNGTNQTVCRNKYFPVWAFLIQHHFCSGLQS